ncbi:endonuclease/exonuclease/phosphatase family protein [Stenotrophomonas sp. CFBP8980]|uniref:endonuclease/exonuclease/phosphatase family protein n=1 Tax=Stenotrophomonas sp. CFBP8980 TaxID=3096523 RepID=UPI002A6A2495|nr:endonuclease/exonuclease/phosphatase family protein [Stenotrophomonas sp. CFBP8980]
MELRLLWWNVGILNGIGRAASDSKRSAAISILGELIGSHQSDLIGLCEISVEDVRALELVVNDLGYGVRSLHAQDGKVRCNMCVVYRVGKLRLSEEMIIHHVARSGGKALRLGVGIVVTFEAGKDELAVVLSHWPSRLYMPDRSQERIYLGSKLLDIVSEMRMQRPVVLMGDYNDEPYSDSIFHHLGAVRDSSLALANGKIYNPFWKHLSGPWSHPFTGLPIRHGTHRYGSARNQTWWLFDQIMFTHDLLTGDSWVLDESGVGVIPLSGIGGRSKEANFDHLPVVAQLNWSV